MRRLLFASVPAMAALLLWTPAQSVAQTQKPAKPYSPKRMADGHPDLQGTYDIATMTPIERPRGAPAAYPPEEARRREYAFAKEKAEADAPISGDRATPKKGGEATAPAGSTTAWLDRDESRCTQENGNPNRPR